MLEQPPALTIAPAPSRLDAALLRRFADAETAHVVDALGGRGALDYTIKPLPGSPDRRTIVGTALTCDTGPGDCLAILGAIELAGRGDVVLVTTRGFKQCAVAGDILLGMLCNARIAAFVTDGLVRDSAGVLALGVPVYCCGLSPNSPAESGPGTAGLPIVMGDVAVRTGDLVVADRDGIVIVPRDAAEQTAEAYDRVCVREAAAKKPLETGQRMDEDTRVLLGSDRVARVPRAGRDA